MTNAIHRTPCLETAEIKMLLNGRRVLPRTAISSWVKRRNCLQTTVAAGFEFGGYRQFRRRRAADTEWIVGGEPPGDLWTPTSDGLAASPAIAAPVRPHGRRRSACTTPCAGRGRSWRPRGRCAPSPLYDLLVAKNANLAARTAGNANFQAPGAARRTTHRQAWLVAVDDGGATRHPRSGGNLTSRRNCCCRA